MTAMRPSELLLFTSTAAISVTVVFRDVSCKSNTSPSDQSHTVDFWNREKSGYFPMI